MKKLIKKVMTRIKYWYLSHRARSIEKALNDELLIKGVISTTDATYLVPKGWKIVNQTVEIASWEMGYARRQYPLRVVPKNDI